MFVGRNFWKSLLLESEKSEISLSSSNAENLINRLEYTVNMMCREKILLMQKQILSMQKNIFDYCEI